MEVMALVAARGSGAQRRKCTARRFEVGHKAAQLDESVGVERVIDPAAFLSVGDEAGVLENLQMKRESGLSGVESVLELADAPLTVDEHLDDRHACFVGECVTECGGA